MTDTSSASLSAEASALPGGKRDGERRGPEFPVYLYAATFAAFFLVCAWAGLRKTDAVAMDSFVVLAGGVALEAWVLARAGLFLIERAGRWARGAGAGVAAAWALGVAAVNVVQAVSMFKSGSLLLLVALENYNQLRLVAGSGKYYLAGAGVLILGAFVVAILRAGPIRASGSSRARRLAWVAGALAVCVANAGAPDQAMGGFSSFPPQTPAAAFALTSGAFFLGLHGGGLPDVPASREASAYYDPGETYPFLQEATATEAPGPAFPFGGGSDRPNVIVLFLEGVSPRTLGCYDERRRGLTPHIDAFAAEAGSMRVSNYYSHTAATFRGIHGQLASCFPSRAVWENRPRDRSTAKESRARHSYFTLTDVFAGRGYETVFFTPHLGENGLNSMLDMLGFESVYPLERARAELLGNAAGPHDPAFEEVLTDREIFDALAAFLRRREGVGSTRPVFAGLYNIGTHASFDVPKTGLRFGDGSNPVLNNIHNLDAEFGRFFEWFRSSGAYRDTLLVLTTDHAHYPEPHYRMIVGGDPGYRPFFCDEVPLIFHAGNNPQLPRTYDAGLATSLGFAPSLLHFLGVHAERHSFLGRSLFAPGAAESRVELLGIGPYFAAITRDGVREPEELAPELRAEFDRKRDRALAYYFHERHNRVYPPPGAR